VSGPAQPPGTPDGPRPVPTWRQDFPFTAAGEEEVTRREFVRFLTVGSVGAALGSTWLAASTSLRTPADGGDLEVVAVDDIPVPGTYLFSYPTAEDPAILVRPTEDRILGYSQRCTHLACVVYYEHDEGELICPCHGGHFDAADGRNVSGPPQRPLNTIELEIRDGVVWAVGGGGH
jgi:Rieske Fe-S protein